MQPRGRAELEQIQHSVFETIRTFRGPVDRDLSIRWRGVEDKRPTLARYVPLWVLGTVGAGVCLFVHIAFLFALNSQSDPVSGRIALIGREAVPLEARAAMPVVQSITLSDVLSDDPDIGAAIDEGLMQIEEGDSLSRVRLWDLFPSGQGSVGPDSAEHVSRVARGIAQFGGRVQVTGHTDDVPIRSLRFPSNWILSERRAASVVDVLRLDISPDRLASEGRADTQPLVANDSAVNRALNRRVEITLFYEAGDL